MGVEYRQLGTTGVRVSPLCLGAMNFGGDITEESEAISTIRDALDAGLNFIDTANVYSRGGSESVVGKALRGCRDDVVLATKVHGRMGEGPNDGGSSRRHIKMQCEASLRRLQTDHIDLYQLHRPDEMTPIDETLSALDDLIRSGKVMYVGVSSFSAWQTMEAISRAEQSHLASRPASEQPLYNLLDRRVEREVLPLARKCGLAVLPWSPLAYGVLSGKYSDGTIPEESRLARYGVTKEDARFAPTLSKVWELEKVAASAGVSLLQLALGWLMAQPQVTSPIIGPRDRQQLVRNLAALDVEIDADTLAAVDATVPPCSAALRV